MEKRIKVLLIVLVVIEIISTYFMYKSSHNKNVILDKVELKEIINKDRIAIMIDEDGSGTYKEYTGNTWPSPHFAINSSRTICINEKGDKIDNALSYNASINKLELLTGESSYCTIYFDKAQSLGEFCDGQKDMGECITSKKSTIEKVENMTSNEVGGMYRYQGTDNVNNWICFGTSNKEECTKNDDAIDKYMYRIIGVTPEGELALIKETAVKEGDITIFQWNDKFTTTECGADSSGCNWANSKLYNRLNGLCKSDNSNCTGTTPGTTGDTNIFIGNSNYDYLKDEIWLNKINDHEWKYGSTNKNNGNYNGNTIYEIESKFEEEVQAKIGLQYLHDYFYAYPNGNPGDGNTATNAWIHLSKDEISGITSEWLISKYGVYGINVCAWFVNSSGTVSYYTLNHYGNVVRPVFYLKSNIKISNTEGSKTDPFIIPEPETITQLRKNDTKNQLTTNLVGGIYRYQGTDEVNNWICFGTTDKTQCTSGNGTYGDGIDKYMYRIIGVTPEGELALIKETRVKEESTKGFQWNDKYRLTENDCGTNGENCTWEKSRIYNRLNGLCQEDNPNCNGTGPGYDGQTNIFIGNNYYDYLTDDIWLNKINDHEWKYGDTKDNDATSFNGDTIYAIESKFSDNITAKIGLQYIHDYYYAYPGGKPGSYSTAKNAWIHLRNGESCDEWLISRYGVYDTNVRAWFVGSNGYPAVDRLFVIRASVRPVFYLKSDIKISNTEGSKTDPFIIEN